MKKIVVGIIVLTLVVVICFLAKPIILLAGHIQIQSEKDGVAEKYASYSVEKQPYTLITQIVTVDEMEFVSFRVLDNTKNEIVFAPDDVQSKWRTMDLKSIAFDEESYDIVVLSGDVGRITYKFQENGTWQLAE